MEQISVQLEVYRYLGMTSEKPAEFCQQWRIQEFALFGSILGDNFNADSDIDILISFQDDAQASLLDLISIQQELEGLSGREIDLMTKRAIKSSPNWMRRREILDTAKVIYESRRNPSP